MTATGAADVAVRPLRLGTRRSALALVQARAVAALLADRGATSQLVEVTTEGDRSPDAITALGGTGVFVTALRERLLDSGDTGVDVAVHSLKDLPTEEAHGLVIAAMPVREDPSDAVVTRDGVPLDALPAGARVGTGSPRRAAQLALLGLPIEVVPIRGNVDTRLGKVATGELDAVVVARAGLARLGRLDAVAEVLGIDRMLPAPGQGALAIECRAADVDVVALIAALDDAPTRVAVSAERALLAALRAGCTAPVGAHAMTVEGADSRPSLVLEAIVAAPVEGAGSPPPHVRMSATGSPHAPEELGRQLAADLLAAGAAALLGDRQ